MPDIASGSQGTSYTINASGTYTLLLGATRTQTAGIGVSVSNNTTGVVLDIEGSLIGFANQRAINFGTGTTGEFLVGANGLVQSTDRDAFRSEAVNGLVNVTNLGRIVATTAITTISPTATVPANIGYGLNVAAAVGAVGAPTTDFTSGGTITNGSSTNNSATIQSDSADAIRLGAHQTLVNYGTINGNGRVNDSSSNNSFSNTSIVERYDNSRGVRINSATSTNDRIDNYGTITGAQHGVDVGSPAATNILINNFAGGQLIGRNGSGVGADTTGVAAGTVIVDNSGVISGRYGPLFDRAGLATIDGDGDGVDVDGGATVINRTGGTIEGTGAGGYDSGGRANNSEGISIGGGSITNSGTIRGAAFGIVVNNDSNANGSRSGSSATQITNNATGTITGQGGYAIRLENKIGTTADNDTIVNYGTMTGNGAVPNTGVPVTLQDGSVDTNSTGTLDGITYTSTGSARFIRGDGSAIQTGEGTDVLSNYGTITGNSTRALNLEGGNDTLNLYTGSTITGRIDGGAGTDTLNLRQDDRAATNVGEVGANSGVTTGTLANVVNFEALNVAGGTWTIGDAQTYSAGTTVAAGAALRVNGSLTSAVTISGTLTGVGSAGAVTVQNGGTLSAGNTLGTLGTGDLTLTAGSTLSTDIAGRTAGSGYDQINVTGSVSLAGAALTLNFGGFSSAAGDTFVIINNDGSDAITGAVGTGAPSLIYGGSTLTEGSTFSANARTYRLSYQGGTNSNDVTLTDVTAAPPPVDSGPTVTPNTQGGNTITTNDPTQITADLGTAAVDQVNYAGSAPLVLPVNIENVVLTGTADSVVTGNALSNIITGNAGSNTVAGGIGNDTVMGGEGTDLIYGNQDADLIYGNQGADVLYGGQGDDRAFGGQGADRLFGNLGNDVLYGNRGADIVYGNQGSDIVYGNQGADILFGGQGNDVLYGGQDNDTLVGGIGDDTLVGGLGADLYRFDPNSGRDLILGFNQQDGDRIALGGQTYTVSSAPNGDALLTLSGGGVVDLAGIRADQVNASYFAA